MCQTGKCYRLSNKKANYSVPVPVAALLLVLDESVLPEGHLDLAIGHVKSQQGDDSSPCYKENQPFGQLRLYVKREMRPETQEGGLC